MIVTHQLIVSVGVVVVFLFVACVPYVAFGLSWLLCSPTGRAPISCVDGHVVHTHCP